MLQTLITQLISPKKCLIWTKRLAPWFALGFITCILYGAIGGLFLAPSDAIQGEGFRILYVHVPSAILSLLTYSLMAIAAILGLSLQLRLAFVFIRYSISLGASFTFLALVTGSIWGKPMWGTWWIWDARLTSELLLFFIYLALFLLQNAISHDKSREKIIAWFVLIGAADIPIIHYSVNWWNTLHQGSTFFLFSPSKIAPSMSYPALSMLCGFLFFYAWILSLKIYAHLEREKRNIL